MADWSLFFTDESHLHAGAGLVPFNDVHSLVVLGFLSSFGHTNLRGRIGVPAIHAQFWQF